MGSFGTGRTERSGVPILAEELERHSASQKAGMIYGGLCKGKPSGRLVALPDKSPKVLEMTTTPFDGRDRGADPATRGQFLGD
jgi:hypothetical protein